MQMGYQAPSSFQIDGPSQTKKKSKSRSHQAPQFGKVMRTNSSQSSLGYQGMPSTSYQPFPSQVRPYRGPLSHVPPSSFPAPRLPIPTQPFQYQPMPTTSYRPMPSQSAQYQPMPSASFQPYMPYGYGLIPPPTFKIGDGQDKPKGKASRRSGGCKKSDPQETKENGKVYVQNIVVTAKMRIGKGTIRQDRDDLNLKILAMNMANTQYNPESFAALRVALRKPQATVNVFRTGQMVCAGAKSIEGAKRAIRMVSRKIQKVKVTTQEGIVQPRYPELELLYIKVQNIVGTVHMGFSIDLDVLCRDSKHERNASYDPELFSAAKYVITDPKVTANIFSNGKLNLLGAKSMADLMSAHAKIVALLGRYKKGGTDETKVQSATRQKSYSPPPGYYN